jgi:plastocyanin
VAVRDVYLKIERIPEYSPVAPMDKTPPPITYKRDGMRNHGHEDGTIPDVEVAARAMTAVVYREYLDEDYLVPRTTKIVAADLNEPIWERRVPGAVVYAYVGDTLKIHVLNADFEPHSLHVHGLEYGIDSDGSWPFGTQSTDGRRSDEICPGQSWTYTYRVTEKMVGAWPFHDHVHHADAAVRRGLFGGIIVRRRPFRHPIPLPLPEDLEPIVEEIRKFGGGRPARADALPHRARKRLHEAYDLLREWLLHDLAKPPLHEGRLHVPAFFHHLATDEFKPLFDSGELEENGIGSYSRIFSDVGTFDYFCQIHPEMAGTIVVQGVAPPGPATVNILDAPARGFYPQSITVAPGETVTWRNLAADHHTVTSRQGAAIPTHCINGRGFVGNTPTVLARAGQPIRWYVFSLDFGTDWHNFHPHALRFSVAGETHDVRSLSPAESFVVDTTAPPVLILPPEVEAIQEDCPADAKQYRLMGDFLFHCHVHHHLENGMVGVVRSYQDVWLTPALKQQIEDEIGLILYDPTNPIPDVMHGRCKRHGEGHWDELTVAPEKTFMHAVLLPATSKVLYWGYTDDGTGQSRLFDPAGPTVSSPANQPAGLPGLDSDLSDLWSAGHALLDDPDGTVLAHGGFTGPGTNAFSGNVRAFLFSPASEQWAQAPSTQESRFYATTITTADRKALTLYGSLTKTIEVFDPAAGGNWSAPLDLSAMPQHEFYPWTYLLPDGKLFIAGPHDPTNRFDWNPPGNLELFPNLAGSRSSGGEKGTSVLLPLRPPDYAPRAIALGGDTDNRPAKPIASPQTAEIIDLSHAAPAWSQLPDLNLPRPAQVNSVLLPDGRVFVAGGTGGPDGGPCEFFDPENAAGGWQLGPTMKHVRGYHSAMLLLADGSILAGGDPNSGVFERYYPGYYLQARPTVTAAPATIGFGATFTVDTPQAPIIGEVVLMRPGAVTHGFNMHQRAIECEIVGGTAATLDVESPPNGNIAPPGWYLLFLVDANRVPSIGRWIRLT